ncbi:MAG: hypothetical protein ACK5TX_18915, partial [Planctomyces sp.]
LHPLNFLLRFLRRQFSSGRSRIKRGRECRCTTVATAVDRHSDLPFPHTRDATTVLYSTAYDDNWAESDLRTQ